jgi:hypothetical protein
LDNRGANFCALAAEDACEEAVTEVTQQIAKHGAVRLGSRADKCLSHGKSEEVT